MSHTTINTETEPTATIVDPAARAVDPAAPADRPAVPAVGPAAPGDRPAAAAAATPAGELVEDDLLVEDVSIDGMCGVY